MFLFNRNKRRTGHLFELKGSSMKKFFLLVVIVIAVTVPAAAQDADDIPLEFFLPNEAPPTFIEFFDAKEAADDAATNLATALATLDTAEAAFDEVAYTTATENLSAYQTLHNNGVVIAQSTIDQLQATLEPLETAKATFEEAVSEHVAAGVALAHAEQHILDLETAQTNWHASIAAKIQVLLADVQAICQTQSHLKISRCARYATQ